MTQPPQDGPPPDRTREVRLPPVPGRPAVPDPPTDRLPGPSAQRDPTLRLGGPGTPGDQARPAHGQAPGQPPSGQPPWGQPPQSGSPGYGPPGAPAILTSAADSARR